jgi:hypothetical protein
MVGLAAFLIGGAAEGVGEGIAKQGIMAREERLKEIAEQRRAAERSQDREYALADQATTAAQAEARDIRVAERQTAAEEARDAREAKRLEAQSARDAEREQLRMEREQSDPLRLAQADYYRGEGRQSAGGSNENNLRALENQFRKAIPKQEGEEDAAYDSRIASLALDAFVTRKGDTPEAIYDRAFKAVTAKDQFLDGPELDAAIDAYIAGQERFAASRRGGLGQTATPAVPTEAPPAPPNAADRKVGQIYSNGRGGKAEWTGSGWRMVE